MAAYRKGDFEGAARILTQARDAHEGGDKACDLLLTRIATLQADPPDDWEGIWTFETK